MLDKPLMTAAELREMKAHRALADHYGSVEIERAVEGTAHGYRTTLDNGTTVFVRSLGTALRMIVEQLGHGEDREVLVLGEPEEGESW